VQFLSLSRHAQVYLEGIEQRRMNPRHHLRKIVALSEIHGVDAVDRAIQDGIAFAAYSCEYIANILEMRARETPEPGRCISPAARTSWTSRSPHLISLPTKGMAMSTDRRTLSPDQAATEALRTQLGASNCPICSNASNPWPRKQAPSNGRTSTIWRG
jgi:hypothetical protein